MRSYLHQLVRICSVQCMLFRRLPPSWMSMSKEGVSEHEVRPIRHCSSLLISTASHFIGCMPYRHLSDLQ